MADKHAVVRTDLMGGTDVRAQLVSFKYMPGDAETAIENGNIVKLDSLIDGEREVFKAVSPSGAKLSEVVLVAGVEVFYDATKKSLDDYINEAGKIVRGYRLHSGDAFSATAEAFDKTPKKGDAITLGSDTKLAVGGSGEAVGKIEAVETAGRFTFYVVRVA